jgi:3D (Asp-Asp-Asp) domain-containing protein
METTAYCQGGRMADGVPAHPGAAAMNGVAFGTRVTVESGPGAGWSLTVEDRHAPGSTGLDVFMRSCAEALAYGRREAEVAIG